MSQLAAVILTLNEEAHIEACIDSVRWADDIVVFDSFSSDRTVPLAEKAGARVIQHTFQNYGAQRDAALQSLTAPWVFFIDADERATPALAEEVRGCINGSERGWWVPRHNYIFGKLTLGAGWYPDYQLRVMQRESARYDPGRPVHEEVILDGPAGYLKNPLIHHNYQTITQFRNKQVAYSKFEAGIRISKGLQPKPWTYVSGPIRQFVWRFVTLKGYRDGWHGLRLSLLMAYYEYRIWRYVSALDTK